MEKYDNMDIEEMLDNPLKNVDVSRRKPPPRRKGRPAPAPPSEKLTPPSGGDKPAETDIGLMEKNHPLADRVLSLEKNTINTDQNVDTLRRIIDEQNERIRAMEDELTILREHLPGEPAVELEEEEPGDEI